MDNLTASFGVVTPSEIPKRVHLCPITDRFDPFGPPTKVEQSSISFGGPPIQISVIAKHLSTQALPASTSKVSGFFMLSTCSMIIPFSKDTKTLIVFGLVSQLIPLFSISSFMFRRRLSAPFIVVSSPQGCSSTPEGTSIPVTLTLYSGDCKTDCMNCATALFAASVLRAFLEVTYNSIVLERLDLLVEIAF